MFRKLPAVLLLSAFAVPTLAAEALPVAEVDITPKQAQIFQPPITVKRQRVTEDQLITSDVVRLLASNPRLAGRIGVQTKGNSVDLSGVVTTPGMVRIAMRDARTVEGVKEVRNNLYTQVGGSRF